ncbi:hypothetical protein ACO2Q2_17270 [Dyella sp. KRB-257]|uniref:hypothetical protein n=1 Tax=Dyella sp. KRB-257 TaxID=3400915 RepID=UPI003C06B4A1
MKQWSKFTFLLALALLVAGCANLTASGTRTQPKGVVQFQVASNYQDVYRLIYKNAQRCLDSGSASVVRGTMFPDNKTAEVMFNLVGTAAMPLVVDIKAAPTGTSVTSSYAFNVFHMWEKSAKATELWAQGDNSFCPDI